MRKILDLVFKLDILPFWKTYNVVNIKYLLSYPGDDPFRRVPPRPGPVYVEKDNNKWKLYKIETFLNKRLIKRKRKKSVEYLVK